MGAALSLLDSSFNIEKRQANKSCISCVNLRQEDNVSDPRKSKRELERNQVEALLKSARISFRQLEFGGDPPDIVVMLDDTFTIDVEVTEYHPEGHIRVTAEDHWNQFRSEIELQMKSRPQF
jgi:hypothetical protein